MVERVAEVLGPLRDRVVFLGGSTTGLLVTDPAAPAIRTTKDVDVIVEVSTQMEYHALGQELRHLGFRHDTDEGAPICRWTQADLVLDVMPTDAALLGFSNRWYPEALQRARIHTLSNGLGIRVVTSPYFLATKLEAFYGRGEGDFLGSHDLEDLVAVVDGRAELLGEVRAASLALQTYLAEAFTTLLKAPDFTYAIQGHLPPDPGSQGRFGEVVGRLHALAKV